MQQDDRTLLNRFATDRDEAAFRELSRRYLGLIFHAALRRTGSRPLAEEASQNVLCALAKKAASLAKHPERLPAWLHRATLFESSKIMRSENSQQRRKHLQHPDDIPATAIEESSNWREITPHLDLALDRLSDSERTIIFQHYFEKKTFPKIAALHDQPPATVQKKCRRAIKKLSRILRGKGFVLSATALASGIGTECAKAAPAGFAQSVTTQALSTYSAFPTSKLTLFMASKSKALIPIVFLITGSPLVLQQVAISHASTQLASLRTSREVNHPASRSRRSIQTSHTTSSNSGKITIHKLQRVHEEAHTLGGIKWIELDQMVNSLDPDELAELIPQALKLQRPISHNSDLHENLIKALGKIDPERTVRLTFASSLRGRSYILSGIFSQWALIAPDAAFSFYLDLENDPSLNPISKPGFDWIPDQEIALYHSALLGPLICMNSPRSAELISRAPTLYHGQALRSALDNTRGIPGVLFQDTLPIPWSQLGYENFIPLIREFVPDKDLEKTYRALLDSSDRRETTTEGANWLINHGDLLKSERELLAKVNVKRVTSSLYSLSNLPHIDSKVDKTRRWLEQYLPEDSQTFVEQAKQNAYDQEMYQARNQLERLNSNPDPRQFDIINGLSQNYFGEYLPEAHALAKRIKDPEKRAEVIKNLKKQEGYQP